MTAQDRQEAMELLGKLPQQDILALAKSLTTIARAQVAAGQKLSPEDQAILDRANATLPSINNR